MVVQVLIVVHVLPTQMVMSLSLDEIFLPRYINWSINFRDLQINDQMVPSWLKHMNSQTRNIKILNVFIQMFFK